VRKTAYLRSWKSQKCHGKDHAKSWNFKSFKEYEPYMFRSQAAQALFMNLTTQGTQHGVELEGFVRDFLQDIHESR